MLIYHFSMQFFISVEMLDMRSMNTCATEFILLEPLLFDGAGKVESSCVTFAWQYLKSVRNTAIRYDRTAIANRRQAAATSQAQHTILLVTKYLGIIQWWSILMPMHSEIATSISGLIFSLVLLTWYTSIFHKNWQTMFCLTLIWMIPGEF